MRHSSRLHCAEAVEVLVCSPFSYNRICMHMCIYVPVYIFRQTPHTPILDGRQCTVWCEPSNCSCLPLSCFLGLPLSLLLYIHGCGPALFQQNL